MQGILTAEFHGDKTLMIRALEELPPVNTIKNKANTGDNNVSAITADASMALIINNVSNDKTATVTVEPNNKCHDALAEKDKVKFSGAEELVKVLVDATKRHEEFIATTEKEKGVMHSLKFDKPNLPSASLPKEDSAREKIVTANKAAGSEAAVSMVSSHQPSFSYKKL